MRSNELYAAAVAALERCPPAGSRWRHRSGGEYVVVQGCVIEATLTPAVLYVSADAPVRPPGYYSESWVRPLDEFLDGRFTPVEQPDATQ